MVAFAWTGTPKFTGATKGGVAGGIMAYTQWESGLKLGGNGYPPFLGWDRGGIPVELGPGLSMNRLPPRWFVGLIARGDRMGTRQ